MCDSRSSRSFAPRQPTVVKRAIVLVAFGLIAAGLLAGLLVRGGSPANDTAVAAAPAFSLPSVTEPGEMVAHTPGRPTVVYFFASWCIPCREEAPVIEAAARSRSDVAFVGVNHLDHVDDARAFMNQYGLTVPAGHDPGGSVALKYRLRGLPATVFVGPDGDIVSTLHGQLDTETLDQRVDALVLHESQD